MKKHPALVSSPKPLLLLLVLVLAGSGSAVPLPDTQDRVVDHNILLFDPENFDPENFEPEIPVLRQQLVAIGPILAEHMDKGEVELDLDSLGLVEVVRSEEDHQEEDRNEGQVRNVEHHQRRKRQLTLSGGADVQNTRGGRRILGTVNVGHNWGNKHSLSGNFGLDHARASGFPSQRNYNAGLKYTFTPNKRTSLHVGAQRNWGSSGRSHSFGVGFSHSFGRK